MFGFEFWYLIVIISNYFLRATLQFFVNSRGPVNFTFLRRWPGSDVFYQSKAEDLDDQKVLS